MRLGTFSVLLLALSGAPVWADDAGEQLFVDTCSGCHQLGGIGQPGLAPPLVDKPLWDGLGDRGPDYLAGIMVGGLTGTITAGGQKFIGLAMPPHDWMSDEEMLAVAAYVLQDLNGLSVELTPEVIVATRAAPPSHADLRALRKEALP